MRSWRQAVPIDIRTALKLLAIAAENRAVIDADLVQHILEEVEHRASDSGDLGHYVRYSEELFKEALALPRNNGIKPRKAARSLAPVS